MTPAGQDSPPAIDVRTAPDAGDPRGLAFTVSPQALAAIGGVADVHLMTVRPGSVRGNHLHARKREVLVVLHRDDWELHWEDSAGVRRCRVFAGSGGVTLTVQPSVPHAIRNTGTADLIVAGLSPVPFDPADPDNVEVLLT